MNAGGNCSHTYLGPAIRAFLRGLPTGARVVDLGCGNGSLTSQFAEPSWDVHGVDISTSAVQEGVEAYKGIHFHVADVTGELGFLEPCSFDAVVAAEVIEHLYAPRRLLSNAHKLLKPGGRLVITTPYHGYLKNLALALTGGMDSHFTALWDGGHIKFWSQRTLESVLKDCGFSVLRFKGVGRTAYLWKSMVVLAVRP